MTIKKLMFAAALAAPMTIAASAATAQVGGIGIADPQAAIANSKAWGAAKTQIETTYKAQIDAAEARRQALAKELQPLYAAFDTARRAPGATDASLRPQATALQAKEAAANQELGRMQVPFQRAQQYAIEQIQAQLAPAVQSAVRAKNVSLLVSPQAVLFAQPAADITPAVTAELDKLVTTVSTTPPANWQPGQQGQQGGAPAPAAAAAAPARNQPQGR